MPRRARHKTPHSPSAGSCQTFSKRDFYCIRNPGIFTCSFYRWCSWSSWFITCFVRGLRMIYARLAALVTYGSVISVFFWLSEMCPVHLYLTFCNSKRGKMEGHVLVMVNPHPLGLFVLRACNSKVGSSSTRTGPATTRLEIGILAFQ